MNIVIAPWLPSAMVALIIWGVAMFLPKLAVRTLPPFHLVVYSTSFSLFGAVIMLAFYGFPLQFEWRGVLLTLATGILGTAGWLMYVVAIRHGSMIYGVVMTSLYPVVTALLSFWVLGERLTDRQMGGLVLGVCALILMVVAADDQVQGQ